MTATHSRPAFERCAAFGRNSQLPHPSPRLRDHQHLKNATWEERPVLGRDGLGDRARYWSLNHTDESGFNVRTISTSTSPGRLGCGRVPTSAKP